MTRIIDIIVSFLAMLVLLPFMIPIMIILKCTGEHDIFYRQERLSKDERTFGLYKFATMLRNSPNMTGGCVTAKNDPRILPIGGFLRKTKINELPQLLNIFFGDMSFVGPRPQTRGHFNLYTSEARDAIASMRPGLTGIGSLVFRDEENILSKVSDPVWFHDHPMADYKGQLEIWYFKNQSLYNYFKIIILTAWSVVSPSFRGVRAFKGLPEVPEELREFVG